MNRFEIIGVNYSGKSTLLEAMLTTPNNTYFYSADEILKLYKNKHPYNWFLRRVFREFLIKFFHYDDFSSYQNSRIDQIDNAWLENYKYSLKLTFRDYIEKFGVAKAQVQARRINTFVETLFFMEGVLKGQTSKPLILEEFFYHRNAVLFNSFELLEKESNIWKNDFGMMPAGLIYLYCDDEFLHHNIEKRRSKNLINKQHIGLSNEQIVEDLKSTKQRFETLLTICENSGMKVLKLDSRTPLANQSSIVKDFVLNNSNL